MNEPQLGIAIACTFVWLGMVLAISFIEAPLKFRAPGVDLAIGLGIGRVVFRALNAVEVVLALVVLVCALSGSAPTSIVVMAIVAGVILLVQLVGVRPSLTRRSNQVLAGENGSRSHAHHVYIALEVAKVVALLMVGVMLVGQ